MLRRLGDQVGDVVAGELDELLLEPALADDLEPGDVRAVDLEEERVARVLLVEVPAEHPELRFVVVQRRVRLLAAAGDRLVHELADVVVVEGQGLADRPARSLRPGRATGAPPSPG